MNENEPDRSPAPDILGEAWDFVRRCAAEDFRGPMPDHVRRAREIITTRCDPE